MSDKQWGNQRIELRDSARAKWLPRLEIDPRFSMDIIIDNFHGPDTGFLSNFYPFEIEYNGLKYPTSEAAYQAAKANDDQEGKVWSAMVREAPTPGKAKKIGKQIPLRSDWEQIKFQVMKEVLITKFRDTPLMDKLFATKNSYLIEGTLWHDNFWGICVKKRLRKM